MAASLIAWLLGVYYTCGLMIAYGLADPSSPVCSGSFSLTDGLMAVIMIVIFAPVLAIVGAPVLSLIALLLCMTAAHLLASTYDSSLAKRRITIVTLGITTGLIVSGTWMLLERQTSAFIGLILVPASLLSFLTTQHVVFVRSPLSDHGSGASPF